MPCATALTSPEFPLEVKPEAAPHARARTGRHGHLVDPRGGLRRVGMEMEGVRPAVTVPT